MARHQLAIPPRDEDTPEMRFLKHDLCMEAVGRMEVMFAEGDERFPSAVETMWELLNDDREFMPFEAEIPPGVGDRQLAMQITVPKLPVSRPGWFHLGFEWDGQMRGEN